MIEGYIIAQSGWPDDIKIRMGARTFAHTTEDAWRYHVGYEKAASLDFSIYVQRWHDRGYKPFRVRLSLVPPCPEPTFHRSLAGSKDKEGSDE